MQTPSDTTLSSPTTQQPGPIDILRTELAVLQEAVQRLQVHDAPLLTARYLATVGEREYKLLQLQVDVRAYRRRIELAQARRNHGQSLDPRVVADIVEAVNCELLAWRATLKQRQQDLALAQFTLHTLQYLPAEQVQRAKQAYRQLARCLHPDAHPENTALFEQFWPAVQAAYLAYDVDQLETLVQVIGRGLQHFLPDADDAGLENRLQELIALQARQLADLQAQPPLCYRALLDNAQWVQGRCAELDLAIDQEATQLAALVSRFADLCASSQG